MAELSSDNIDKLESKKVINFAPTGTQTTSENSNAPLSPNQIIEEVHEAYELGITLTHIHARDPLTLLNTCDKSVYESIILGIKKHCKDLPICVSLTGRLFPEFERRSEVLELYPDMGSLTMSSINFPKSASINAPDMILKLIQKMRDYGVTPEIECFDSGMLNYAKVLMGKKILPEPHYINVILGNLYNAQTDVASISAIINNKPENSILCFGGIGKEQLTSNMVGLLYADGIRIGLEDNFYYRNKERATNIGLLKRIHRIIDEFDMTVIKPSEFKQMGYANRKTNDIGL